MKWGDIKEGSGDFISLKNDKDAFKGVVVGEPHMQEIQGKGGARKSFLFNIAQPPAPKCKTFRCGVRLAAKLREAVKDGKLCGKVEVQVVRNGAAGDQGTTYAVEVRQLTSKEIAAAAKCAPLDLQEVEIPDGSF